MSRRFALLLALFSATIATTASAQDGPKLAHSSQMFALELRFSPYRPDVDGEFANGSTPFASTFGTDNRLLFGIEFDYQPLRLDKIGSLGVGIGASYTKMGAPTLRADTLAESAGTTSLNIFPFHLVAVARIDALREATGIPLSFYGKAGVTTAAWNSTNTVGNVSKVTSGTGTAATVSRAEGMTWGTFFAAGLALDVGFLDERSAKALDEDVGINHTYLFFELTSQGLTGFGSKTALRLSDLTWNAGLTFEF